MSQKGSRRCFRSQNRKKVCRLMVQPVAARQPIYSHSASRCHPFDNLKQPISGWQYLDCSYSPAKHETGSARITQRQWPALPEPAVPASLSGLSAAAGVHHTVYAGTEWDHRTVLRSLKGACVWQHGFQTFDDARRIIRD